MPKAHIKNKAQAVEGLMKLLDICPGTFILFGTLLGAVREGKLIEWDGDIDVGILFEDWHDSYFGRLQKAGFSVYKKVYWQNDKYVPQSMVGKLTKMRLLYKDPSNRFCFDVMAKGKDGKRYHDEGGKKWGIFNCPAEFVEKREVLDFYGKQVTVPSNTIEFLRFMYGDDWKTPIENYYFTELHNKNRERFITQ